MLSHLDKRWESIPLLHLYMLKQLIDIASFKATGICPLDRSAVEPQQSKFSTFKPETLAERTGLAYIPFYNPSHSHTASKHPAKSLLSSTPLHRSSMSYSEPSLYEKSLLGESSAEDSFEDSFYASVPLRRATSISNFLVPPITPSKLPTKHGKSSGTVLTSLENLQNIEDRERKKQEEAQSFVKENRKKERERKKLIREEQAKQKMSKKSMPSILCSYYMHYFFLRLFFSHKSCKKMYS